MSTGHNANRYRDEGNADATPFQHGLECEAYLEAAGCPSIMERNTHYDHKAQAHFSYDPSTRERVDDLRHARRYSGEH